MKKGEFKQKPCLFKNTLEGIADALESPLSFWILSLPTKPGLVSAFFEKLEDDSISITGLLGRGETEASLNSWFRFPSKDWNARTWILPACEYLEKL